MHTPADLTTKTPRAEAIVRERTRLMGLGYHVSHIYSTASRTYAFCATGRGGSRRHGEHFEVETDGHNGALKREYF